MARRILTLLLLLVLLTSCTSIRNEIARRRLGVTREELEELKKTADPDVVLTDSSALMVKAMHIYADENGMFSMDTENIPLTGERKVIEVELPSCVLWISYPEEYDAEKPLPVIFFTHGGAYVQMGYKSYQELLGTIADRTGCVVFCPDYSLSPEEKFPRAVEDVWEAYGYLLSHAEDYRADTSRIILMGDSAGGNFAAGLAIRIKEEKVREPRGVILMYPSLLVYPLLLPSHLLFGGFDGRPAMISLKVMEHSIESYLEKPEDGLRKYASPLLMLEGAVSTGKVRNIFSGCAVETDENGRFILPDHLIILAEADSLRDEGMMYHASLTALGTSSTLSVYKGTVHGFVQLHQFIDEGEKAIGEAVSFIREHTKEDNPL